MKIGPSKLSSYLQNHPTASLSSSKSNHSPKNSSTIILGLLKSKLKSLESESEYTIGSHSKSCTSVIISKSNDFLISSSSDSTIKFWSLSEKTENFSLSGHSSSVTDLYLSKSEEILISSSLDKSLKVWSIPERLELMSLNCHLEGVTSVNMSPDEQFIVSGSVDSSIKIWNFSSSEEFSLQGHSSAVVHLSFTPDGKILASSSNYSEIILWDFQKKQEIKRLRYHRKMITSMIISNDGKFLLSSSEDKKLKVFDLIEKKKFFTFKGLDSQISAIALSNDGKTLASAGHKSIKIWKFFKRCERFSLLIEKENVKDLKFSSDKKLLVAALSTGFLRIWNLQQRRESFEFSGHNGSVLSMVLSSTERFLVSGSEDRIINVWNFEERKLEFSLNGESDEVNAVEISKDDRFIIGGYADSNIKIWNFHLHKEEFSLKGHSGSVFCLKISKNSNFLLSGSQDRSIKLWDLLEKSEKCSYEGHSASVFSISLTPDEFKIISGSEDSTIIIWDIQSRTLERSLLIHFSSVNSLALSENGKYLATGSTDKTVKLWNLLNNHQEFSLSGHATSVKCVNISKDNKKIVSSSEDGIIKVWSIFYEKQLFELNTRSTCTYSVIFTQNGNLISGNIKNIKFWNFFQRSDVKEFQVTENSIKSLVLSKDAKLFFSCSEGKINSINSETGAEEFNLPQSTDSFLCISLANDEKFLAAGGKVSKIYIYDLLSRSLSFSLKGHTHQVLSLTFSINDKYLLSSSSDTSIKIWDLLEKSCFFTLKGHNNAVNSVLVSPDLKWIFSGSSDASIKRWNFQQQREEDCFRHKKSVTCLQLAVQGQFLVSGSSGDGLRVWNLRANREEFSLNKEADIIYSLALSNNEKYVFSSVWKEGIHIWNISEKCLDFQIVQRECLDFYFGISYDGSLLASSSKGNVKIWKICEVNEIECDNDENFEYQMETEIKYSKLVEGKFNISRNFLSNQLIELKKIGLSEIDIQQDSVHYTRLENYFLSPQSDFDHYYQDGWAFWNVLDCFQKSNFELFNIQGFSLFFTCFKYQLIHFLALRGDIETLNRFLIPSSLISFQVDYFGKSPFFYSIKSKHQNITDLMLNYLIVIESETIFQRNLISLKNDFFLLIENSSILLPQALQKILLKKEYLVIPERKLPTFHLHQSFNPKISDFNLKPSPNEIPATINFLPFELILSPFTLKNIQGLTCIQNCKISGIYETHLIRNLIDLNWEAIYPFAMFYSILVFLNVFFFTLLVKFGRTSPVYVSLFIVINLFLIVWELIKAIFCNFSMTLRFWNIQDCFYSVLLLYWLIAGFVGVDSEYEDFLLGIVILNKGIAGFRIFNGTRYYIQLIIASLDSVKYFLIMFFYMTFFFSLIFTISMKNGFDFDMIWNNSWEYNFGSSIIEGNQSNYPLFYISTFVAKIINVVIMLNMLISILGDSYDCFLLEKHIIDYKEKLQTSIQIQKMMFWKKVIGSPQFFHVLLSPLKELEMIDWQGKILYLEKKQEQKIEQLSCFIQKEFTEIKNSISGTEEKIIKGWESKVGQVENKMSQMDKQMIEINQRIIAVESNIQKLTEFLMIR